MTILRIIAAVVDTRLITLYEEGTGKAYEIPQGDPRVQQIVDKVLPVVQQGLVAEFHYEAGATNPYGDFQKASGGFVRLFRVAKSRLAGLFGGGSSEEPTAEIGAYGNLPAPGAQGVEPIEEAPKLTEDMGKAVGEIIKHAEPVTDKGFSDRHTTDAETMIAVTGTGKDQRILPGVEKLKGQFAHAAKLGSTLGVQRLIERLTAIIGQRQHSVEDVLKFLEKGDLPVADDGSIIAYKRLYRKGDRLVDPHTRKVKQRVGSYVCVDESLVDRNRRNECSNGLHIGRRQYMGSFSGDVITLCKIAPEDVVTVPHGDPNKVRVCGYHIIAELGDAEFKIICENKPMTDSEKAQSLLARAIRGEHIGRIEEVRITQQRGDGLVITPLENGKKPTAKGKVSAPNAMALDDARVVEPDPKKGPEARADVRKAIEQVTPAPAPEAKAPMPPPTPGGPNRVQKMRSFYTSLIATKDPAKRLAIAQDADELKKRSKIGWQTFGLSQAESQVILDVLAGKVAPTPEPKPAAKKAPKTAAEKPKPVKAPEPPVDPLPAATEALAAAGEAFAKSEGLPVEKQTISGAPDAPPAGKFNRQTEAKRLFSRAADAQTALQSRTQALTDLDTLKRKSKVSWTALGIAEHELDAVRQQLAKGEQPTSGTEVPPPAKASAPASSKSTPETKTAAQPKAEVKSPSQKAVSSETPKPTPLPTKAQEARMLFDAKNWSGLHAFKKASKKSWEILGFRPIEIDIIVSNKPK